MIAQIKIIFIIFESFITWSMKQEFILIRHSMVLPESVTLYSTFFNNDARFFFVVVVQRKEKKNLPVWGKFVGDLESKIMSFLPLFLYFYLVFILLILAHFVAVPSFKNFKKEFGSRYIILISACHFIYNKVYF